MGMMSSIRFAKRARERQMRGNYGRGNYSSFVAAEKKTDIEKWLNQKREAYPNSWRYFVNRLSVGLQRVQYQQKINEINLSKEQQEILDALIAHYWNVERKKLIIPGTKNMNFFDEMTKLVPNFVLLKQLYGRKNSWANQLTEVKLKSPVSGAHWNAEGFKEHYLVPLLMTYNFHVDINKEKPRLIQPQTEINQDKYKLEKVLVTPVNIPKDEAWKYGKSYWAWLPALSNKPTFSAETKSCYIRLIDKKSFWRELKNGNL